MVYYVQDMNWNYMQEEIEFLNHLIIENKNIQNNFFKKIGGKDITEKYESFFNKKGVICIPKKITNLSFFDKLHLKKPENIYQFQNDFKKYCELIEIKKMSIKELDMLLSPYFQTANPSIPNNYIIFVIDGNRLNRFRQFLYLIEGIGSKKIQWKECHSIIGLEKMVMQQLNQDLKNLGLKDVAFWYNVGTSAISPN